MISLNHMTVDFGNRLLFDDISFVVGDKERVALVGKNGVGKSTLLKIIAGEEEPTSGTITHNKGLEIGYLPQVMQLTDSTTLWQEAESVFAHVKEKQELLDSLAKEMEERTDYDSEEYHALIERYTTLHERISLSSTAQYQAQIEKTLIGLGFTREDFTRYTKEFSGGWRMRVELAKILLAQPDLLLLDEPTNHLDIESIEWLEQFLKRSKASLILVSHDRSFLDAVTSRTIELELGKSYDYNVSYSQYIALRDQRIEMQRRAYENQQKMIEDTEAFIEKFRYKATKAVQVQSRIKQLSKIERITIDERDESAIHFHFPEAQRSGDYPLIVDNLSKSFGQHNVFHNVTFTLKRGEKVAFVGKNGSGKTTMVRCIMEQITDFSGTLKLGHNVSTSYFSQNRALELNPNKTIRQTVDDAAVGDIRTRINDMLGAFMFGGETADKPVSVLSGGERSRLAILLMLLSPSNLLILDEPTNHLDIRSKEVLKEAIQAYKGTVIVVSHDRYFLSSLVDKVYEFREGKCIEYLGGFEEYYEKMQARMQEGNSSDAAASQSNSTAKSSAAETGTSAKSNNQLHKENQKKLRALQRDLEKAEEAVSKYEEELAEIEQDLASGRYPDPQAPIYNRYKQVQEKLQEAMIQWEKAEDALNSAM